MIPTSRPEVDAPHKKKECLQLMEQQGEAHPRRGVVVVELQAMVKELLFSREGEQEKPTPGICENELEPAGGQGTTTTETNIREPHEEAADQNHTGRPCAAGNTERLRLSGLRQARSQDAPGGSTGGPRILWIDQVEEPSHWKLKRFSSWLKMQSVCQEPRW